MKKETVMKILDRVLALLFNACLLFSVAVGSVFAIASSPQYYYDQFEATGVYATVNEEGEEVPKIIPYIGGDNKTFACFTDEQLNELIDHIIGYLFTDMESFALVMDDVTLYTANNPVWTKTDGVNIFSDVAVSHMADVKGLLQTLGTVALVMGMAGACMLVYFIVRAVKGQGGVLFKYTLIFYGTFVGLIGAFCLFTCIQMRVEEIPMEYYLDMIWRNFHFIIFPNPEQATGSFFNDTLTMILSLDLFMAAVVEVLVIIGISVVAWAVLAKILDRRVKKMNV
ncbi:MAG: DUF1461 domain-containing protein [Clostridia bacterium]|nr:DUF1461 domain-containing protein [Clostridia bacterium]